MIFVDTGAWFAAFVPNDPDYPAANQWLDANNESLITTDYVIDELFTLLKVRGEYARAEQLGGVLLREDIAKIHWVTPDDVLAAWDVFQRFRDKAWSFTDCVSRSVMERLKIETAFAFDEHFRQFGTVRVVP